MSAFAYVTLSAEGVLLDRTCRGANSDVELDSY